MLLLIIFTHQRLILQFSVNFSVFYAKNFEKITHGTFNQSNSEFGETARTKAASKPLTAEMSVRKGLPSWKIHICLMAGPLEIICV